MHCLKNGEGEGFPGMGTDLFRAATGLPIATYFSAVKTMWMLENVPSLRAKAEAGDATFENMDTWLIWNLYGRGHVTDVTNTPQCYWSPPQNHSAWEKYGAKSLCLQNLILVFFLENPLSTTLPKRFVSLVPGPFLIEHQDRDRTRTSQSEQSSIRAQHKCQDDYDHLSRWEEGGRWLLPTAFASAIRSEQVVSLLRSTGGRIELRSRQLGHCAETTAGKPPPCNGQNTHPRSSCSHRDVDYHTETDLHSSPRLANTPTSNGVSITDTELYLAWAIYLDRGSGTRWINQGITALPKAEGGMAVPDLKAELLAMSATEVDRWASSSNKFRLVVGDIRFARSTGMGAPEVFLSSGRKEGGCRGMHFASTVWDADRALIRLAGAEEAFPPPVAVLTKFPQVATSLLPARSDDWREGQCIICTKALKGSVSATLRTW
ncbi:unnamed protein product [Phytophthora fragariaefolia]|uniref:Unnamed protein product n=1 Tax=Phytophthora fragariaefolia TaxID=1490495 RepID=A0A9W6Y999_9STRA|nr:unnamed protein product [Phytophthora fragariaefolia]